MHVSFCEEQVAETSYVFQGVTNTVNAQKGARALIFLVMGLNQALKQTGV